MCSANDDLLQRAIASDRDALAALLEQHAPAVRRSLRNAIPRRWRALLSVDDVLQQTYADAFLHIGHFDPAGPASFATWLGTLAQRNVLDALRMLQAEKRGGGRPPAEFASPADSVTALYELLSGTTSTPSRRLARQEACNELERALRQLPAAQQQAVRLYDLEGLPVAEIAGRLGRSVGAVYMLRARAHQQLREQMGASGKYFGDSA